MDYNKKEMGKDSWDRLWDRPILTSFVRKVIPDFEQLIHTNYRTKINKILKGINFTNSSVLELGCGSGMNSVNLFKDYSIQKATLVDFSEKALKIAKENTKGYNINLVYSDIFNLELDELYDFVFSIGLIEHFKGKRREEAIRIHKKFLKESGKILIIVPRECFVSEFLKSINQIQGYQEYYFTDSEIEGLFEKNNLKIIKKDSMIFGAVSCYLLYNN